ncbi:hypothetical protein PPL_12561 [Heterostelium album PN500]|uniref:Phospholipid scramblase n=1 Tax=Heterostelium pallidum (strain ATCC 26659 / Pp 5 / PN500) TaxID=670386 RepID=D3BMY7_HETP5|nr:hypothetical protein PPL_12561 [Heterostelium album PN500]EFA77349.1 hypothetical protein PPL_12561 [Heterostelium album PN500]|eukprot:XP_020429478.1 hypothetical protein PPL_12561 [Heterostelium album PN500]
MVKYFLSKKLANVSNRFKIYDENDQVVYYTKTDLASLGLKLSVFEMIATPPQQLQQQQEKEQHEIYYMKEKVKLSMHRKFEIYKGGDHLHVIAVIRQDKLWNPTFSVKGDSFTLTLKGNKMASHFQVLNDDGIECGRIEKTWRKTKPTYELDILDSFEFEIPFFFCFALAIDRTFFNNTTNG